MSAPAPSALAFPVLHASHAGIWMAEAMAETGGEVRAVSRGEAVGRCAETPVLMLNAPLVGQRLGYPDLNGPDLLELFAFVYPARFMVPTPMGLARALALKPWCDGDGIADADVPQLYRAAVDALFATMQAPDWAEREGAWDSAQALYRLRWPWGGPVSAAIAKPARAERWLFSRLPEWEEKPPRPQPKQMQLDEDSVTAQLAALTGAGSETRAGQRAFAVAAAHAFAPRVRRDAPNMLLAEAGTGIGKTLGYLAPASLWSRDASGTVWISTYTKALQRQLTREARRIYPDAADFGARVVVRKGRENYLCLLNLEDALQGGFAGRAAILAQLVARWAAYSRDGDMVGGDLPGWLPTLFRRNGSTALTDRRGECIYAGCPHYRKCFIERAARDSMDADIVIANHALVMVQAARGAGGGGAGGVREASRPTRYIFDEGHHLFDAADAMFGAALTGREAIELRRWLIGPEGKARGRRRGLAARLADIASYDEEGGRAIEAARDAAGALPSEGWLDRVGANEPFGALEALLHHVRRIVHARDEQGGADAGYGLETEIAELDGPMIEAAAEAADALGALHRPLLRLAARLEAILADAPDWLDAQGRARVDGALASLGWRGDLIAGWIALLGRMGGPADPDFVDWLAIDRAEGREFDIGIHRHWLDPMRPVADIVYKPAHGVMVTSATLKGSEGWDIADARTGAVHLDLAPRHFEAASPFDYASAAEVLIVTDVKKGDMAALSHAYARLIEAAGGGALGLFTAIKRLRIVHSHIADRLARTGLPIYAQHIDPIDTGTLVDIFRDDPHASLLGTDALRDGVDVPGQSLRLVVMEGVPWPKPGILHRARKLAGGTGYDERIVRARLAQAFGRLIRRADDRGRFVLLSSAVPSRLLTAFPDGTVIRRVSLDEAVASVKSGLFPVTDLGQGKISELPGSRIA